MTESNLSAKELKLINNIINKLQVYMEKTNKTLYSLSESLGFEYQPFYRLIKNKKMPTVTSLAMITDHLKCSIEELISDNISIDVHLIKNFNEIKTFAANEFIKISIPINEYIPHIHNEFIVIKLKSLNNLEIDYCKLYFKTDIINADGIFVVEYENKILELNVTSTSSKFIIAELNDKEIRISHDQIKPMAKFVNNVLVFVSSNAYIHGVRK